MKEKERVQLMIERKPVDYLPSQLDFLPARKRRLCKELGLSDEEIEQWAENHFYQIYPLCSAEYYSSGSSEDWERAKLAISWGLVKYDQEKGVLFDNWGVGWKVNPNGVWPLIHPLEHCDTLKNFLPPDPTVPGLFEHVAEELPKKRQRFYVVGLQHISLFERAWTLMGYETFMRKVVTDIGYVEQLLDMITEYNVGLAQRFVEIGVDAVRTGDDYGCQFGLQISPDLWRKLFKDRLAKVWKIYRDHNITVMHHSCGNVELIIPDMIEIGLQVLHPVQPYAMSLGGLAEKFGDVLVFHGGIDTQRILPFETPDRVKKEVQRCVEVLGRQGRYIIAPSQEIMNEVPLENIVALVEAIKEYRKLR